MPSCHSCGRDDFPDFRELALHISSETEGHWKGKKWAAKFLCEVRERPKLQAPTGKRPDMSQIKVELSGKESYVNTICPRCKTTLRQPLPIEYTHSPIAWHIGENFAVLCQGCRSRHIG